MESKFKITLIKGPKDIATALLYGDFTAFDLYPSLEENYSLFIDYSKNEKEDPGIVVDVVEDSEVLEVWPPTGLLTTLVTYEVMYQ